MTQISNEIYRAIKSSSENENIDDGACRLTDLTEVLFLISKFLVDRGINHILSLCEGHILPGGFGFAIGRPVER